MKTISINAHDKNSSECMSISIRIDGVSEKTINRIKNDFFDSISERFTRWYYDVECFDDLTKEEEDMLKGIGLEV